jgi:hypothetical protein
MVRACEGGPHSPAHARPCRSPPRPSSTATHHTKRPVSAPSHDKINQDEARSPHARPPSTPSSRDLHSSSPKLRDGPYQLSAPPSTPSLPHPQKKSQTCTHFSHRLVDGEPGLDAVAQLVEEDHVHVLAELYLTQNRVPDPTPPSKSPLTPPKDKKQNSFCDELTGSLMVNQVLTRSPSLSKTTSTYLPNASAVLAFSQPPTSCSG